MDIFRNGDKKIVAERASEVINSIFQKNKDKNILLLLSGGSALGLLVDIKKEHLGHHLTIGVLDERHSRDENINNFSQIQKTKFYRLAVVTGANFINTRIKEKENLKDLVNRFERELKNWKKNNVQGIIVITQGIGADGHTAGIMPYPKSQKLFKKLFEDKEKWVMGYDAGSEKNQYPQRVTVTMPFLRNVVDVSIVYLAGGEKKEALDRVLSKEGTLRETPGRIIREMKNVSLFTDII